MAITGAILDLQVGLVAICQERAEAAAKTPFPPNHSSEWRTTVGWDHPYAGKEHDINSSLVSHVQLSKQISSEGGPKSSNVMPVIPIEVKPVGISQYTPLAQVHAIDSILLTQAPLPIRRLYVENMPPSAFEKAVLECINNFLLSLGVNYIKGTLSCITCMINKDKCQALLEFLTPEDAAAALSFDGKILPWVYS